MVIERVPVCTDYKFDEKVGTINLNGHVEKLLLEGYGFTLYPYLSKVGDGPVKVIGISLKSIPPTKE